jgi:hypothetical protein
VTKKKAGGSGILVDRSVDKASVESRVACSKVVEVRAGDSPILKAVLALEDARDKLVTAGAELKEAAQGLAEAELTLVAARHSRRRRPRGIPPRQEGQAFFSA